MIQRSHRGTPASFAVLVAALGIIGAATAAPTTPAPTTPTPNTPTPSAAKTPTKPSASAQKAHDQILKAYGVYGDQALQDYVGEVGQRIARQSTMPDAEFKFVVLDDDSIVVRPMMYVALSYDDRIIDGQQAVTFLVRVKERLEDPERMLLRV